MRQTAKRGRPGSHEAILAAAETVVAEDGAGHLTLDAVAARARLSKGGVLYNFPTKQALVGAMLTRLIARFDAARARAAARIAPGPNAALRAYIAASLADPDQRRWTPVLAAGAEDPSLLDPARRYYAARLAEFDAAAGRAAASGEHALIAWLAAEGLCFLELFGLLRLSPRRRARLGAALQRHVLRAAGDAK
jgi:AcrR family transcriptional regulator